MSPSANLVIQWRTLRYYLTEFGNAPIGQQLVLATLFATHNNGWSPSVLQLSKITGLPRSTVSRHVAFLIEEGFIVEEIDSQDRRKRHLHPTAKGDRAREKTIKSFFEIVTRVTGLDKAAENGAGPKLYSVDDLVAQVAKVKQ